MSARERNHYACCLLPCILPFRGKTALPIFPKIFLVFRLLFRVRLVLRGLSGGGRLPLGVLQPRGSLWSLLPGLWGGRPAVSAPVLPADPGQTLETAAALAAAPLCRLHGLSHPGGAGRLLSLPGTDRELALADLCQLPLPFSRADRLGGLFFLYVLQPLLDRGLAALSPRARGRLAALLAVLMGIDLVFFLVGTFS